MNCPYCNLLMHQYLISLYICDNHKIKVYAYKYSSQKFEISFLIGDYSLYIEGNTIDLYDKKREIYHSVNYFNITPETAESVVEKILSLKAFL